MTIYKNKIFTVNGCNRLLHVTAGGFYFETIPDVPKAELKKKTDFDPPTSVCSAKQSMRSDDYPCFSLLNRGIIYI